MNLISRLSVGASAAALALGVFTLVADAQQGAPAPQPGAAKAQSVPPVAKAPAAKAEPKKAAEPKKVAASPCQGIEQAACAAKTECTWIAATKRKDGKDVKAYCRAKPAKSAAAAAPKAAPKAAAPAAKAAEPKKQ
jgi:hypothetical protein